MTNQEIADLRSWCDCQHKHGHVQARLAALALAEIDWQREFTLQVAERLFLAAEVLSIVAERKKSDGVHVERPVDA